MKTFEGEKLDVVWDGGLCIHVVHEDGGAEETADARNEVVVASGGPLYLRGELRIEGAPEEKRGLRFRAALWRCGRSGNKPFCDGSHKDAGFRAD